jgi:hypothetical protein
LSDGVLGIVDVVTGFGKVAAPIMATAMRRANRKDLQRLKRLLEGR